MYIREESCYKWYLKLPWSLVSEVENKMNLYISNKIRDCGHLKTTHNNISHMYVSHKKIDWKMFINIYIFLKAHYAAPIKRHSFMRCYKVLE